MPLRNRVTPEGEIVAYPARGLMMGNRGCLHGQGRDLGVARWRSKLWICCVLEWKGVRRDPMPPGRWTALFFLDDPPLRPAPDTPVELLTPPAIVAVLGAGYRPLLHPSAS